jgi:hypothetical protein
MIVQKQTSTFPLSSIPIINLTLNDLIQEAIAIKRQNCPKWTDETSSDFGMIILDIFTKLCYWMKDHMELLKNNAYIGTAVQRDAMRALCALIDYTLSEDSAASVTITFTCAGGHPEFTIYEGTKIGTKSTGDIDQIIFEVSVDTVVTVGTDSIDIVCIQGETVNDEILGSSDGTTGQVFLTSKQPVVWQSETVEIFDGAVWTEWTRVTDFVNSIDTSTHYIIGLSDDGYYKIEFGDGVNGTIPVRSTNNIRISYRHGGGTDGNVAANTIIEIITSLSYVTEVNNELPATGGAEQETLEHAKRFAPASLRTLDRVVTQEDVENICNAYVSTNFGGIAKSKAAASAGGLNITIMIVPHAAGLPAAGLKTELAAYLNARKMACTYITVVDPVYVDVNITVTVYPKPNYSQNQVAATVRQAIVNALSANYQKPDGIYPHEFGADIYISNLYEVIEAADGVDHSTITLPTADISIGEFQIADVGTIIITVSDGTDTGTFTFPKGN